MSVAARLAVLGLPLTGCLAYARGQAGTAFGIAAAIWAYRETAGEPCGEWLLGATSLYVTTLAWAATVTGAAALLFVDVCSL